MTVPRGTWMGWAAAAVLLYPFQPVPALAQARVALDDGAPLEARVWLDRGSDPLLQQGDQVRVYYRAAEDAYVAIFHIDTDGTATLAFPHSPDEDHYVRGGRDYRLLFPRSAYWYVDDAPGVGYFFIVASSDPFNFSSFRFSAYDRGWDLSRVGRQVYRDPYVAMDDYIAALLPDWQTAPYALDFTSYDVGQRHDYPRFLCYECHTFRAYSAWNPYYTTCTDFRVVIYDDPYFYPARRYRGQRVVWAQPLSADRAQFSFKARARGEPAGAIVAPRPIEQPAASLRPAVAPRRPTDGGVGGAVSGGVVTPPNRTATPRSGAVVAPPTGRTEPAQAPTVAPDATRARPVLQKRPSEAAGAPPSSSAAPSASPPSSSSAPSSGTRTAPTRPPTASPTTPSTRSGGASSGSSSGGSGGATSGASSQGSGSGGRTAEPRSAEPRTAPTRPPTSSGGTTSSGSSSSGGSSEQPTVRRTPDGRPVIR